MCQSTYNNIRIFFEVCILVIKLTNFFKNNTPKSKEPAIYLKSAIYPSQCNVEKTTETVCILWPVPAFGWGPVKNGYSVYVNLLDVWNIPEFPFLGDSAFSFVVRTLSTLLNYKAQLEQRFVIGILIFLFLVLCLVLRWCWLPLGHFKALGWSFLITFRLRWTMI